MSGHSALAHCLSRAPHIMLGLTDYSELPPMNCESPGEECPLSLCSQVSAQGQAHSRCSIKAVGMTGWQMRGAPFGGRPRVQEMDLAAKANPRAEHWRSHLCPLATSTVWQVTVGAHLKDGVFHITDLYAGAVICWFAGKQCFEPEREHRKGDRKTHRHIHRWQETAL